MINLYESQINNKHQLIAMHLKILKKKTIEKTTNHKIEIIKNSRKFPWNNSTPSPLIEKSERQIHTLRWPISCWRATFLAALQHVVILKHSESIEHNITPLKGYKIVGFFVNGSRAWKPWPDPKPVSVNDQRKIYDRPCCMNPKNLYHLHLFRPLSKFYLISDFFFWKDFYRKSFHSPLRYI